MRIIIMSIIIERITEGATRRAASQLTEFEDMRAECRTGCAAGKEGSG